MNPKNNNLLLIFTRNPELGKCKTRLAAKIGDKAALEVYKFLLQHTVSFTQGVTTQKEVYYSETIWEDDIWDNAIFQKRVQKGSDLGQRMLKAFADGFAMGFKKIVIIGSDMYDLSQSDIEEAFEALDEYDYVIGPAEDGGYYLLGMTQLNSDLFQNKAWGRDTVLSDTLKDLQQTDVFLLPEKNDIDHYEDIKDVKAFQPFLKHMKE